MRKFRWFLCAVVLDVVLPITEFRAVSGVRTARKPFFPDLGGAIDVVNLNGTPECAEKPGGPIRIAKLSSERSDDDDILPVKILPGKVEKSVIDRLSKTVLEFGAVPVIRISLSQAESGADEALRDGVYVQQYRSPFR